MEDNSQVYDAPTLQQEAEANNIEIMEITPMTKTITKFTNKDYFSKDSINNITIIIYIISKSIISITIFITRYNFNTIMT